MTSLTSVKLRYLYLVAEFEFKVLLLSLDRHRLSQVLLLNLTSNQLSGWQLERMFHWQCLDYTTEIFLLVYKDSESN